MNEQRHNSATEWHRTKKKKQTGICGWIKCSSSNWICQRRERVRKREREKVFSIAYTIHWWLLYDDGFFCTLFIYACMFLPVYIFVLLQRARLWSSGFDIFVLLLLLLLLDSFFASHFTHVRVRYFSLLLLLLWLFFACQWRCLLCIFCRLFVGCIKITYMYHVMAYYLLFW